jgi:hypothetical protein
MLSIALAATAAVADDNAGGSSPKYFSPAPTWQWRPFGGWTAPKDDMEVRKPAEKKPAPKAEPAAAKKSNPPAKHAPIKEDGVAERSRQETALLRRLQACDKLKEIALRTHDPDLLRRAEQLEERAQACYAQRTARVPALNSSFESDEKTIDRYLDTGKSRSPAAVSYAVSGDDRNSRAVSKEVQP